MPEAAKTKASFLVNGTRLWSNLMEIAKIGSIKGNGSCRLSLSDEDRQARDLFARWCVDAGCAVTVDEYGNMFATRPGLISNAPCILVGSHLDTQPHGGRFDGILGVLAGLEIVRALNDSNIQTSCPIVVVNWTNEEGVRFKPGLTGSAGFVGTLDKQRVLGTDGSDFFGELERIGYAGKLAKPISVRAYYEFHIEQGPVLEQLHKPAGVVTGIQGVRWYEIELVGRDAHAGTTPMANRQDSFMAAAELTLKLREKATFLSPDLRFTVGRVEVSPNSQNTIPGNTKLFVDLRHSDSAVLDAFETIMVDELERSRQAEVSQGTMKRTMIVLPAIFDIAMQCRLQNSARSIGLDMPCLPSGAMHDASSLAKQVPTAMLFVQSRGGISHNPDEWSEPDHIELACEILARTILSHSMEVDG
jgi:beta-ureidopropionase / N-carbamoyl-L-amino-acid hydrolase